MTTTTPPVLPKHLMLLERGWLSSNCILGFDGAEAALIDSGYVTHAPFTDYLVGYMMGPRRLTRLINTHVHSDHMGGNALIKSRHPCTITIPAGCAERIEQWDEDALILRPAGQSATCFDFDATLQSGDCFEFGELQWQAIAVPGHDPDMLAFYNADKRTLISGDALWQNGFGILFPALAEDRDVFNQMRRTLNTLGQLPIDLVLPGHGPAFADVDAALRIAESRLAAQEARADRLAMHALKALLMFRVLDVRRLQRAALGNFLAALPLFGDISRRFLNDLAPDALADQLARELVQQGALREVDGWLQVEG